MKPNLCPDFPVLVGDWLASTSIALMSPAEEGAYWRLLCHAWGDPECCLPGSDDALAQLSRLGPAWAQGSGLKIRACFAEDPERPGFIFNAKQRETRHAQAARILAAREQRSAAAKARWDKPPHCDRNATAMRPHTGSTCGEHASSPLSPLPSPNTHTHTAPASPPKSSVCEKERFEADTRLVWLRDELGKLYRRPQRNLIGSYDEEALLAQVCRRPDAKTELAEILTYRGRIERRYFPQSVKALLEKWQESLDKARSYQAPSDQPSIALKEMQKLKRDAQRL